MRTVVPFDATDPKSRLAPVLDEGERAAFSRAMLRDVVGALTALDREPTILTTAPIDTEVPVTVDERPLTAAVNRVLAETDDPVSIVMADLALVTPTALSRLYTLAIDGGADIVIAPGRGGGTNALVIAHPDFRVDYHGASYRDHCTIAADLDGSVAAVDSFRLSADIDEPIDLPEVLLHGTGDARQWLQQAGFDLEVRDGRVGVAR